jgi:prevent-host-death family protein
LERPVTQITMTATELRNRSGDVVEAALRGDQVAITRHGRVVAYVVPAEFDPRALAWIPAHPHTFDHLQLTGEIIPGTALTPRRDTAVPKADV